jgi:hypothetical protein
MIYKVNFVVLDLKSFRRISKQKLFPFDFDLLTFEFVQSNLRCICFKKHTLDTATACLLIVIVIM